jgi:hypothetical protein
MKFAFPMITRSTFLICILFLISEVIPTGALGQGSRGNQSGWRATVECDYLVVYSQMSIRSVVVGRLKKGDVVSINLEFIGAGGAWCSVTEPGKRVRLGYVQSECLERKQPESVTVWQAQSPPAQTRPDTEPVQRADSTAEKRPTRDEIEQEVDRVLASRLNALLPASDSGQTAPREPFWFDQSSFFFLPGFGKPLNFPFHHIAPRVTGSVQIRPGHIMRRR